MSAVSPPAASQSTINKEILEFLFDFDGVAGGWKRGEQTAIHQPSTMKRFSIVDWFVNWWALQLTAAINQIKLI